MAQTPFNDRIPDGIPLAYFITFRTYGTWLPGDSRGTVDDAHNTVDTPLIGSIPGRMREAARRMRSPRFVLTHAQREIVDTKIGEVCEFRGWRLWEKSVRSNHVHVVVSANSKPEAVMHTFKAWSTRRLAEEGEIIRGTDVWERHGSTRYLWDQAALDGAIQYVRDMQDLPDAGTEPRL